MIFFFFLFLVMSISDFGFRVILASYNEFGSNSLLF